MYSAIDSTCLFGADELLMILCITVLRLVDYLVHLLRLSGLFFVFFNKKLNHFLKRLFIN